MAGFVAFRNVIVALSIGSIAACQLRQHSIWGEPALPVHYSAEAIRGRIVDADSGEPVSNVAIAVAWELHGGFHGGHQSWLLLADAVTNTSGEFHVPPWGPIRRPHADILWTSEPTVYAFKAGYELARRPNESHDGGTVRRLSWNGQDWPLRRFTGDTHRYAYNVNLLASELSSDFFHSNCDWENLPHYLGAIYRYAVRARQSGIVEAPDMDRMWAIAAQNHHCRELRDVFGDAR